MNQTKLIRLKFMLHKLRTKGKTWLALKLIDKYKLTQVSEAFYD